MLKYSQEGLIIVAPLKSKPLSVYTQPELNGVDINDQLSYLSDFFNCYNNTSDLFEELYLSLQDRIEKLKDAIYGEISVWERVIRSLHGFVSNQDNRRIYFLFFQIMLSSTSINLFDRLIESLTYIIWRKLFDIWDMLQ